MTSLLERKIALVNFIRSEFRFLVNDFQFLETLEIENSEKFGTPIYYILKYTNQKLKRHLAIIIPVNSDYKLITLKRIIADLIPNYYDVMNTIKIEDLDLYHSPTTFDFKQHIAYSDENRLKYFTEMANKLRNEWINYLTGNKWVDRAKIDELYKVKKFIGDSGFRKDKVISKIKDIVNFLKEHQYEIIVNSNEEEPFKYTSHRELILYNKTKDIYLKFKISYKDKILSFEKRVTKNQSYRLLDFIQFTTDKEDFRFEDSVKSWVHSELEKGNI